MFAASEEVTKDAAQTAKLLQTQLRLDTVHPFKIMSTLKIQINHVRCSILCAIQLANELKE